MGKEKHNVNDNVLNVSENNDNDNVGRLSGYQVVQMKVLEKGGVRQ